MAHQIKVARSYNLLAKIREEQLVAMMRHDGVSGREIKEILKGLGEVPDWIRVGLVSDVMMAYP